MTLEHWTAFDSVVTRLRALPHVEAIGAYGSTATQAWAEGSDIDLIVITSKPAPVESLHFFIDGIPVDLSVRNRQEWDAGNTGWTPPDGLRALWDPHELFQESQRMEPERRDARQSRYRHRHLLLKLKRWQTFDPEISDLLAAGATHFITVSYFHARGMRFPGIDKAVPYLREHDPELLRCLHEAPCDTRRRIQLLTRAIEFALAPEGGMWRDDEVFAMGWRGRQDDVDADQARALFQTVWKITE